MYNRNDRAHDGPIPKDWDYFARAALYGCWCSSLTPQVLARKAAEYADAMCIERARRGRLVLVPAWALQLLRALAVALALGLIVMVVRAHK